jgi:hypothetical protein
MMMDTQVVVGVIRYVNCRQNQGCSVFHYSADSGTWQSDGREFVFEYSNFVDAISSQCMSGPYVMYLINGRATFQYCVFSTSLNLMFSGSGIFTAAYCVTNVNFPATVSTTAISVGSTATYDPGVSVSVCLVPPGTAHFSPTRQLAQTAQFTRSVGWIPTDNMTISARVGHRPRLELPGICLIHTNWLRPIGSLVLSKSQNHQIGSHLGRGIIRRFWVERVV